MRTRYEILSDIVHLKGDLSDLQNEISLYPWDIEAPIISISKDDLITILSKSINGEIEIDEIVNWSNAIESREDVSFESNEIQEVIFELANPEINGKITKDRLLQIINEV